MGTTGIEWTDATWNPVTGCTKVSPGCKFCYAERVFPRAYSKVCKCGALKEDHEVEPHRMLDGCDNFQPREFTDVFTHTDRLEQPLRWRRPRRVFVNSMSDLFHDDVSEEFITRTFSIMAAASWHQFQILTKRPLRMFRYIESHKRTLSLMSEVWPIPNVWLGVSVENQEYATRLYTLAQTPAAVRFCSYEPALGYVNFRRIEVKPGLFWDAMTGAHEGLASGPHIPLPPILPGLDWLIVGGESGPEARPFDVAWALSAKEQCGILTRLFVKQFGSQPISTQMGLMSEVHFPGRPSMEPHSLDGSGQLYRVHLKDRKGGDISEWPEDLRVRDYPR